MEIKVYVHRNRNILRAFNATGRWLVEGEGRILLSIPPQEGDWAEVVIFEPERGEDLKGAFETRGLKPDPLALAAVYEEHKEKMRYWDVTTTWEDASSRECFVRFFDQYRVGPAMDAGLVEAKNFHYRFVAGVRLQK